MEHKTKVTIGDYVQFSYRKNPDLQLTGYVVNVLQNTIVVDITEIMGVGVEIDDVRQVVKHGCYNRVVHKQIKSNVS
ncbi:DUF2187 family protein [Bacillus thuringiensis]|uniref:DUF2187 family protein n=1 Tax=Bacillus thuringiensis TaxID=1428 RepID=A0AAW9JNC3_BACTU|nr:DUF2187 family protein [Bacillus thuringiensis]MDZ5479206.1 DUF2187 family protein [Bacillus thuringiensis]MRB37091.1 DUF2187 domain-containing protein [Bacillus thuringiensis]